MVVTSKKKCPLEKFIYIGHKAHVSSAQTAVLSREGIVISERELERIDRIISPLIMNGQSIPNIFMTHKDDIMLDESTIYKYVKLGLFDAKTTDLLNVVKMKPRRKASKIKVEKSFLKNRTYRDFLEFIKNNPDTPIVQMDSVEGIKGCGEAVLLTIHFVESELMLAFKREANTARSVTNIIDDIYEKLGHEVFVDLFKICLCDRGSEFSNPSAIETTSSGIRRSRVFYTDAGAPYQKGACENNHSLIRRVIPKGTSLNGYSQEQIELLMNNINSYKRKKLNNRSAIETFNFFHNKLILEKLDVSLIEPDNIILNKKLFN